MTSPVPQEILDALTDVGMPETAPERGPDMHMTAENGWRIPVYRSGALVIGSGAAGLRAAVEMKRRNCDVVIASQSAWGGTSACSGSDKQTLHAANGSDHGDDYFDMAKAIAGGGAMDEDTAYVEAVGSTRMMASLQYLGLPLPQDRFGGNLRYQTDHDETGRATSCGPRTSRLMVKVLAEEAARLGVPFYNQTAIVRLLRAGKGSAQRISGALGMRNRDRQDDNPLGLAFYQATAVVLAAGGPGELYRDSVYPNGCFGALGLALEAGLTLTNLTESQFGIGTARDHFPWNLSGTYMQAMPHIYSVDEHGREHAFLSGYYRTTQELASNVFRKGYQWPFHATRMLQYGSSLVDLAIWREARAGRQVFMDFNRNPETVDGDLPFSLSRLDADVAAYLADAGADQALPIDRLSHMNPLAIELYRRYKIDVAAEPLAFAVNNQHMNGGIAVDIWGRTSLPGCYAVGEAAGTHGVTRPGGAALNAGQVFGTRAGEHIGASGHAAAPASGDITAEISGAIRAVLAILRPESPLSIKTVRAEVQARMSDHAGMIVTGEEVASALVAARALNAKIALHGIAYNRPGEAARALQWQQMALASEAVLTALHVYITHGGGSRGARAICAQQGSVIPEAARENLNAFRFIEERLEDRAAQIIIRQDAGRFTATTRPNRRSGGKTPSVFERDWPDWLTGRIFDADMPRPSR
ncbi:FAD-binding protein [Martelella alba]|uniref:FAD-binding protein n=1 Tax=Martelella alba TaxID=2590451 RepID=A0A506U1J5_9HYPH|nr:FAD-binding protein [Martelella alba]TPW27630.1 FAD-binding protein [Martelella alba]